MKRRSIRRSVVYLLVVTVLAACDAFVFSPLDDVTTASASSELRVIAGYAIEDPAHR